MENYEMHGLTRDQDDVLGGLESPAEEEELVPGNFSDKQRLAIKQLFLKGLLDRRILENDTVVYYLTPKGKKLHNIRTEEESTGTPRPHQV